MTKSLLPLLLLLLHLILVPTAVLPFNHCSSWLMPLSSFLLLLLLQLLALNLLQHPISLEARF
jgi:hypothetical protein